MAHAATLDGPTDRIRVYAELPPLTEAQASYESPEVPAVAELQLDVREGSVEYRRVQPQDVACQAAGRSLLANLLESEQDATYIAAWCDAARICRGPLERELLVLRAHEERNRAASRALQVTYNLAEAEAGRGALDRSLKVLEQGLSNLELLRSQGIPTGIDDETLRQQKLDLLRQREEVAHLIEMLNSQLAAELGLAVSSAQRFWPEVSVNVEADLPSLEAAIEAGLARRADIVLLRRLSADMDEDTVAAARRALGAFDPSLGIAPETAEILRRWTECACQSCELPLRQRQVETLLAYREAAVAAEIQQAWYQMSTALRRVALSGERRASVTRQLANKRALRNTGGSTPWELLSAELDVIQADAAVLRHVMELRRAEVELQRAQGQLGADCGYRPE